MRFPAPFARLELFDGRGRSWPMLALQTFDVLNICLIGYRKACRLEATDAELHSIERHDFRGLLVEVIDKARDAKNSRGDLRFKFCLSRENHS